MAGGVLSGRDGSITFGTGYVTSCHSWTVNLAAEEHDTTPLGTTWKTWIAGTCDWTGTFECYLDSNSIAYVEASQDSTLGDLEFGTTAAAAVFIFEDATTDGSVTGNIIITGADLTSAIGAANTITFTFRGSGPPSITKSA